MTTTPLPQPLVTGQVLQPSEHLVCLNLIQPVSCSGGPKMGCNVLDAIFLSFN